VDDDDDDDESDDDDEEELVAAALAYEVKTDTNEDVSVGNVKMNLNAAFAEAAARTPARPKNRTTVTRPRAVHDTSSLGSVWNHC
jgi:hypothetical protein